MEYEKLSYGLMGLSTLLGCSKSTAWKIKKSGVIDPAIVQIGKTIIIENEKVFECLRNNKENGKGK